MTRPKTKTGWLEPEEREQPRQRAGRRIAQVNSERAPGGTVRIAQYPASCRPLQKGLCVPTSIRRILQSR